MEDRERAGSPDGKRGGRASIVVRETASIQAKLRRFIVDPVRIFDGQAGRTFFVRVIMVQSWGRRTDRGLLCCSGLN